MYNLGLRLLQTLLSVLESLEQERASRLPFSLSNDFKACCQKFRSTFPNYNPWISERCEDVGKDEVDVGVVERGGGVWSTAVWIGS